MYGEQEGDLKTIGDVQDYTIVSDDIAQKFNGVYVGMYATSSGLESKNNAKFDWFSMKGKDRLKNYFNSKITFLINKNKPKTNPIINRLQEYFVN